MSPSLVENAVGLFELLLLGVGVVLLWRHVLSPAARARHRAAPPALPAWKAPPPEFFLYVFLIIAGAVIASFVAGFLTAPLKLPTDTKTILNTAAFQLGLLIGPALLPLEFGHPALRPPLNAAVVRSGLATFLIALPVVTAANLAWLGFLKLTGLPAEQQDLLRMFAETDSAILLAALIVLATVMAPITEELLFRGILFRYLRTRLPRWIALLLPGALFASLHVDWRNYDGLASFVPLIVLAIVFSLAYERTGRIATVMIAHALFNLHSILLLFAGVTS